MRSVNKVILIGNLTRDPEIRQTPSGQNVVTFGLATNREWVTRDGRKQSMAEFHDLVAWAKLADICSQYLKKGKLIYVEGYLKTRSWDSPEGIKKFKTEIVVQDMIMLDKRQSGENTAAGESMTVTEDFIPEEGADMNNGESGAAETAPPPRQRKHTVKAAPAPKAETPAPVETAAPAEPAQAGVVDIDKDLGL